MSPKSPVGGATLKERVRAVISSLTLRRDDRETEASYRRGCELYPTRYVVEPEADPLESLPDTGHRFIRVKRPAHNQVVYFFADAHDLKAALDKAEKVSARGTQ